MNHQAVQNWLDQEFLPWQAKARSYAGEKQALQQRLRQQLPALQTLVGMLLEGQTKRAVMAWNSLGLEPLLAEIVLNRTGTEVMLRAKGGKTEVVNLDEVIATLQQLSRDPVATPLPEPATAP